MNKQKHLTRRNFLEQTARLGAVGMVAPASVTGRAFGQEARPVANDRIHVALIGCGGMGRGNLSA